MRKHVVTFLSVWGLSALWIVQVQNMHPLPSKRNDRECRARETLEQREARLSHCTGSETAEKGERRLRSQDKSAAGF